MTAAKSVESFTMCFCWRFLRMFQIHEIFLATREALRGLSLSLRRNSDLVWD